MKIATWNVNSVRARMRLLVDWLREHEPDVLLLQETKVEDAEFPHELLEDEGYNIEIFGEKTYNGVAVLAQWEIEDVVRGLPGDPPDGDRRVLGCRVRDFSLLNLYVPNGHSLDSDKYTYKLDWLARLAAMVGERYSMDDRVVLAGDFNITFDDRDVWDPAGMHEAIHCSTPERRALADVMAVGLTDGLRRFHEEPGIYTWWHHRGAGLQRNHGMRIDHVLLSPKALEGCTGIEVDVDARRAPNPSDHAPVIATFEEPGS